MTELTQDLITEAVYEDHPCDSGSCDIAIALFEGFVFSAADLLMGATTSPSVDRVRAVDVHAFEEAVAEEFPAWEEWYAANTRECSACTTRVRKGFDCENCGQVASDVA